MNAKRNTKKTLVGTIAAAALLGVAALPANRPTPADPSGPNSGIGYTLAGAPSPVDPYGTTTSGVGRVLAGFPTTTDPNGPNSGVGRRLVVSTIEPDWPKPNSGIGRILA